MIPRDRSVLRFGCSTAVFRPLVRGTFFVAAAAFATGGAPGPVGIGLSPNAALAGSSHNPVNHPKCV